MKNIELEILDYSEIALFLEKYSVHRESFLERILDFLFCLFQFSEGIAEPKYIFWIGNREFFV